jgi:hypothetical protein
MRAWRRLVADTTSCITRSLRGGTVSMAHSEVKATFQAQGRRRALPQIQMRTYV